MKDVAIGVAAGLAVSVAFIAAILWAASYGVVFPI